MAKIPWGGELKQVLRKCDTCGKVWQYQVIASPVFPNYLLDSKEVKNYQIVFGRGDCEESREANKIKISESYALRLIGVAKANDPNLDGLTVEFSKRLTTRRAGCYRNLSHRITLYPRGMTLGTLLHEIVHAQGYQKHDAEFKRHLAGMIRCFLVEEKVASDERK